MSHVTFSRRAAATVNISHLWELCAGLSRTTTRSVQCFPVCCFVSVAWSRSDLGKQWRHTCIGNACTVHAQYCGIPAGSELRPLTRLAREWKILAFRVRRADDKTCQMAIRFSVSTWESEVRGNVQSWAVGQRVAGSRCKTFCVVLV